MNNFDLNVDLLSNSWSQNSGTTANLSLLNKEERLIADSASLKSHLTVLSKEAYEDVLKITKLKTELDNLPENNQFDLNFLVCS